MPETTDFLYPFIEGDETDAGTLLEDLARSAEGKWRQSSALRLATLTESALQVQATAAAMVDRFRAGGRLFTFGNGGSATDAEAVAHLYTQPPWGRALAARSLAEDQAVMTALGNDVGFDLVFSRQLIAHGRAHDIVMGFSTSGNSENLMRAFAEARKQGMLTVGIAGTDGGRMAAEGGPVEQCLVVRSQSVHRIQESQAALNHALWAAVQEVLV
ncbi:MAG: D-sedoheptulose-7-phosphate isomerase [Acidimicrobiales bacterium]